MKFKNPFKKKEPIEHTKNKISINSVPEYPDVIEERWEHSRMTSLFNDFFDKTEPDAHNKASMNRYLASEKGEIKCHLEKVHADSRHRAETLLIEMQSEVEVLKHKLNEEYWLQALILQYAEFPTVLEKGGESNDT